MAYENNTNFYDNTIGTSYAATISGQINRIEDAHEAIRSKAIELGLKIPAGKKLTHNASGTSELALAAAHHILDTAAAINNIPMNSHTNLTLSAGGSYTVPVGYNAVAYTVTASGLDGQTSGTATAADILTGKTAWVNGSKITGSMSNKAGNQTASGSGYYESSNTRYLYLTIPTTGKYTADSQLQSTIPYYSLGSVELPVTITVNATGETIATSSSKTFPAGYYSGLFNIKAVYDSTSTSTNKVINIDNAVGLLTKQSGNLTITTGYDYFAANASYSIKTGNVTAVTGSVNNETGVVTFAGGVTTAGWISEDVTKPATYTPVSAEFGSSDITGKVKVTTAGWVTKDTEIGGLDAGKAEMTGPTRNTSSSAITVGSVEIDPGNYYMTLTKTAGYITSGTVGLELNLTTLSSASLTSAGSSASTVSNKYWKVTAAKGYNELALVLNLTVRDAAYTRNPTSGVITVSTPGWIAAGTYGGLSAGSATMTGPTLALSATTVGDTSIPANAYYMKLVKEAGYITAGTVGINLGRVAVTNSTSTGTATGTINTQKWQVVTSAGYNPSPITTVLSVKSGSVSAASVDSSYNCKVTISEGWVSGQTITYAGKAQSYTIDADDTAEPDHIFEVAAATGTLMKSLSIDTSYIYARLAAI